MASDKSSDPSPSQRNKTSQFDEWAAAWSVISAATVTHQLPRSGRTPPEPTREANEGPADPAQPPPIGDRQGRPPTGAGELPSVAKAPLFAPPVAAHRPVSTFPLAAPSDVDDEAETAPRFYGSVRSDGQSSPTRRPAVADWVQPLHGPPTSGRVTGGTAPAGPRVDGPALPLAPIPAGLGDVSVVEDGWFRRTTAAIADRRWFWTSLAGLAIVMLLIGIGAFSQRVGAGDDPLADVELVEVPSSLPNEAESADDEVSDDEPASTTQSSRPESTSSSSAAVSTGGVEGRPASTTTQLRTTTTAATTTSASTTTTEASTTSSSTTTTEASTTTRPSTTSSTRPPTSAPTSVPSTTATTASTTAPTTVPTSTSTTEPSTTSTESSVPTPPPDPDPGSLVAQLP